MTYVATSSKEATGEVMSNTGLHQVVVGADSSVDLAVRAAVLPRDAAVWSRHLLLPPHAREQRGRVCVCRHASCSRKEGQRTVLGVPRRIRPGEVAVVIGWVARVVELAHAVHVVALRLEPARHRDPRLGRVAPDLRLAEVVNEVPNLGL